MLQAGAKLFSKKSSEQYLVSIYMTAELDWKLEQSVATETLLTQRGKGELEKWHLDALRLCNDRRYDSRQLLCCKITNTCYMK